MDPAPSSITLSELFERIIQWRSHSDLIHNEAKIPWSESHLSAIRNYILRLGFNSHFSLMRDTKIYPHQVWPRRFKHKNHAKFAKIVAYFTQELQDFFVVPKLQLSDEDNIIKFVDFLLQLLSHSTRFIILYKDRIDSLQNELRIIVTILADISLVLGAADEVEQVQILLAEFEAVANEAGTVVYSIIFATDLFKTDKALFVLFEHFNLLKGNIIKFANLFPFIIKANSLTPKIDVVNSTFIVDSLLHDLGDLMNREDDRIVDVKDQIKMLHQALMLSQSSIKDIKVLGHSGIEELNEPVMQVRDAAYEAEYLINSFLVGNAPLWYLTIRLPGVIHKIKLSEDTLQEIKKRYDTGALKLAENFSTQLSLQTKRNSDVDNDIIVGQEESAKEILGQLVGETKHLQIITIFGMPGLGKTTLAKKLYGHPLVTYKFDKRSWCVVSQTYQMKSLLVDILISSTSDLNKDQILKMGEESVAERIYKSLKGRRYLVVMDDIWNSCVWDDLRRYFPDDGNGSRILFTSRNRDAAPRGCIIHELPTLSNDQCWELLQKKVFQSETCPPQLLGIGKQIAASCHGLPLSVVVIAGILSTMDWEESTWEIVGGNLASYIFANGNNSTMQILELSYKHLPDHLKPCFLYFGAFPEDAEIPVGKLTRLWIAEGFICEEEINKCLESVAEQYLMELIDKSLVMVAKRRTDGGVKACVIHDLLRDLCLRRSGVDNFLKLVVDDNDSIPAKQHRLCVNNPDLFLRPSFGLRVRSFLGYLLDSKSYDSNMKLLRVLDCWVTEDPVDFVGIEHLILLRYLAFNRVPTSIGSLVNLEFLIITGRDYWDIYITSEILKMVKLRYFKAPEARFDEDCIGSETNNLEYLSGVCIGNLKDEEMLKCSPHLRKLKCECKPLLIDKEEGQAYQYPDLRFFIQLESLNMSSFEPIPSAYIERPPEIAAEINFPLNIKKLTLSGFFLRWGKMSSVIGTLPKLEVLKLGFDAIEVERWETREGEFQQLKFLKLDWLELAEWEVSSSEHLPNLQKLVLRKCNKLQEIPSEIGEIPTLQLIEVEQCKLSVGDSAMRIHQEQLDQGNEELSVIIRDLI